MKFSSGFSLQNDWWWLGFVASLILGMLETFIYPGLADRWFQSELCHSSITCYYQVVCQYIYRTQRRVLHLLQCNVQDKRRHTVYGREKNPTAHVSGRLRLAGQSQCEKCPLANLTAVTITSTKRRRSSCFNTRIYVSWYFSSFLADSSQTIITSSYKIIHFIKVWHPDRSLLFRKIISLLKCDLTHYQPS